MATPLPSATLDQLRPGSGWACDFAQIIDQAPSGTSVFAHRVGVQIYVVFGIGFSQPPQPTAVAQAMLSQGAARAVYYMEIWEQDSTVLGTGWLSFWYIGVYSD